MRELDHRLRFGEAAIHSLLNLGCLSVEFRIYLRDSFREQIEALLHPFDYRVEVTTCLVMGICVLLPDTFEQAFEFVVGHDEILR